MEPRQEKAIELLASGLTVKKVAAAIGVDERTIRRWKQEPEFALELLDALHETIDDSSRRVQPTISRAQTATNAVFDRLTELTQSDDFKIADRACRTLLNYGFKWATLPLKIQADKDKLEQKELDRAARLQKSAKPVADVNEKRTFANDQVQATPALNPVEKVSEADISPVPADTKKSAQAVASPQTTAASPGSAKQSAAATPIAPRGGAASTPTGPNHARAPVQS